MIGGDEMQFYPTISRGEVTKYCNATRLMLVASSYAAQEVRKRGKVRGNLPVPRLPETVMERAADCGGFVATFKWGKYPYTPAQYVAWLQGWQPQWAAMMDFCCEPEVIAKTGIVRERQRQTTEMAYHFWQNYKAAPWAWVPTIQGWEVEDYQRHAREMKPLIEEMAACYGTESAFRVGIGTLCRRASVDMIHQVVRAVNEILPGVPLHLWGVKLGLLQSPLALPECVASVDSAAWNGLFRTGREEWKTSGLPQRRWIFDVALPRYQAKVEQALSVPKQTILIWSREASPYSPTASYVDNEARESIPQQRGEA